MAADKHPDYEGEIKKLESTCTCLDEEMEYMDKEIQNFDEELRKLRVSAGGIYSDDVYVKETIFRSMKRKYGELDKAKDKPYFGRIDFKELGKDDFETFYIGKTSLVRRKDEKRLVIDWRAPIASLYYSGEIGDVMYTAPGGLIMGELSVKRQYEIDNRKLLNIFDKGITPMDEYLQSALWQKKDNKLKDIVMTIQSEQNEIIRADKDRAIIVQGVAGSGKTTIVLHRIAYLMYTYQEVFTPDKLLILVPNKLFLNYISDVLPDLGVEEINQYTFEDLSFNLLKREYKLTSIEYKLTQLLNHSTLTEEYRNRLKSVSVFKGSLMLRDLIDGYIKDLSLNIVPTIDINIGSWTIYPYDEIKNMFDVEYSYLPLIQRVDRIRKYIEANIKDRVESLKNNISKEYDSLVEYTKKRIDDQEELRKELVRVYDERDEKLEELDKGIHSPINNYFKEWPTLDIDLVYRKIITDKDILMKYSNLEKTDASFISEYSQRIFDREEVEREDLAPLIYLRLRLYGLDLKGRFNHIVIDEAQDYSQFQMYILKQLSSNNSFTIVGDLAQGIHSYKGIKDWGDLIKKVFKDDDKDFLTLKKCYRSTMEIMNFANEVIKKYTKDESILAEPVLRSGDRPSIIGKESEQEVFEDMAQRIEDLKKEGYKSIAVICKTEDEAYKVYENIKGILKDEIHLVTDKDIFYTGGIIIIPAYVAKGLEFDSVLVYNCTKDNYPKDELHVKLLYVTLTRALHKLFIYYTGKPSELIITQN